MNFQRTGTKSLMCIFFPSGNCFFHLNSQSSFSESVLLFFQNPMTFGKSILCTDPRPPTVTSRTTCESEDHTSEKARKGSIRALKPRGDVTKKSQGQILQKLKKQKPLHCCCATFSCLCNMVNQQVTLNIKRLK